MKQMEMHFSRLAANSLPRLIGRFAPPYRGGGGGLTETESAGFCCWMSMKAICVSLRPPCIKTRLLDIPVRLNIRLPELLSPAVSR